MAGGVPSCISVPLRLACAETPQRTESMTRRRSRCGFLAPLGFLLLLAVSQADGAAPPRPGRVTAVPAKLRESLKLDDFYQKYADCEGLPILSSKKVSDAA